jgi:Protein of unknown function (DUF2971)
VSPDSPGFPLYFRFTSLNGFYLTKPSPWFSTDEHCLGSALSTLALMDFALPFLSREEQPPNTLYQYTSLEALVSIVQSKRVWASNIRFLNDQSELLWLRQHVVSILKRKGTSTGQEARMKEIIAMIEAWPPFSLFVASFTEKPDDLSQWRAYCPAGLGVSIGFSTKCLSEQWIANPRDPENPFFLSAMMHRARYYSTTDERALEEAIDHLLRVDGPVQIDPKRALDLMPELFPSLVETVAKLTGQEEQAEHLKSIKTVPVWLSLISPLFKHAAFKDEAEWRKVISKDFRPMPGQKFRQGKSTLVPYVEIVLDSRSELPKRVPQETYFIDEVIVGPTPTPELTLEAVRALFASEGHSEVIVKPSSIPYRSW